MGMVARCGGVRPGELEPQSFADVSVMDRRGAHGGARPRGRKKRAREEEEEEEDNVQEEDRSSKKTGTTTPKTRRESKASAGVKDESLPPVADEASPKQQRNPTRRRGSTHK